MNMSGYWFDEAKEEGATPYLVMTYILEVMLFPQIGTVVGYKDTNGSVTPVYNNCEMDDFSKIASFQEGSTQFAEDYLSSAICAFSIRPEDAVKAYETLAYRPTLHQAKKLSDLPYEEGTISDMATVHHSTEYLRYPTLLLKDFRAAMWKEGFIKQICPLIRDPHSVYVSVKNRLFLKK